MLDLGYHALTEWFPPERLIDAIVRAEKAGFSSAWFSDHFHPWFNSGSVSCSFAWSLMGAVAERTDSIKIGTAVTAPILRYNPAVVAQAFSTMGYLYRDRIMMGLGAGEALNEVPTGHKWLAPKERVERLEESVRLVKELMKGKFVTFRGKYYSLKSAKLYTLPPYHLPIYVAAGGPRTARIAGRWADGIICLASVGLDKISNQIFPQFTRGARQKHRNSARLRKIAEVVVAYDEDEEKALSNCRPFSATLLPFVLEKEVYDPREIEPYGYKVDAELIRKNWLISASPDSHIAMIERLANLGFDCVEIVDISPDHRRFVDFYSKKVIPFLKP
jgi:coenzyme F420-dependent glucose-6-phosphate dehydrogenase